MPEPSIDLSDMTFWFSIPVHHWIRRFYKCQRLEIFGMWKKGCTACIFIFFLNILYSLSFFCIALFTQHPLWDSKDKKLLFSLMLCITMITFSSILLSSEEEWITMQMAPYGAAFTLLFTFSSSEQPPRLEQIRNECIEFDCACYL